MSFEGSNFNNSFWNNWVWVSISRSARPLLNHSKQVWKKNNREWEQLSKNHYINNYVLRFFLHLKHPSPLCPSYRPLSLQWVSPRCLEPDSRADTGPPPARCTGETVGGLSHTVIKQKMHCQSIKQEWWHTINLTSQNSYTCTCKIKIDKNHSL